MLLICIGSRGQTLESWLGPLGIFLSLSKLQPLVRLSRSRADLDLAGFSRFVEDFPLFTAYATFLELLQNGLE